MARRPIASYRAGEYARVDGLDQVIARIRALPEAVRREVGAAVDAGADEMVRTMKASAPDAPETASSPGDLGDSIRKEPGRTELGRTIVADAKDKDGYSYAKAIEYGHKAKNGKMVPAHPFFWTTVRSRWRRFKNRVSRAASKGIKEATQGAQ